MAQAMAMLSRGIERVSMVLGVEQQEGFSDTMQSRAVCVSNFTFCTRTRHVIDLRAYTRFAPKARILVAVASPSWVVNVHGFDG